MTRRMSLPGADELFRTTGTGAPGALATGAVEALHVVKGAAADRVEVGATSTEPRAGVRYTGSGARGRAYGDRRPSGRERHDEKITVYVSAEELIDLEQARLTLRGDHGMAVDRGRIVREALAVVLADLDAKGDASILVRRLRGR